MTKTKLYLDVDGVFLRRTGRETARGTSEFELAQFAEVFLRWCIHNFDCRWLTSRSRRGDIGEVERAFRHASAASGLTGDAVGIRSLISSVPVANWGAWKASGIDPEEDFIWIDDNPEEASLEWLERNDLRQRYVHASTDLRPDDLTRVRGILTDFERAAHGLSVAELPERDGDGRVQYEITGGSNGAVERMGRLFLDVWAPDFDPRTKPIEVVENGSSRLVASRASEGDDTFPGNHEMHRLLNALADQSHAEVEHEISVGFDIEEVEDLLDPSELGDEQKLIRSNNVGLEQFWFRFPPILFRKIGPIEHASSNVGGPIIEAGYYVDPACDPGCCRPDGPFASMGDARAWMFLEYEKHTRRSL